MPHVYWIAFDPRFHYFAFSDRKGNISIRRVADGKETARLPGPDVAPTWVMLKFSPDGNWLQLAHNVTGRSDSVALWELLDGKVGRKVALEHWCDFSADSRLVAGVRTDESVGVYETASGRPVKRIAKGMGITAGGVFRPDGRQLAAYVKSDPNAVVILDLETGKEVVRYDHPTIAESGPAWTAEGQLLACPRADQRIYVWNQAKRRPQSVLEGHTSLGIYACFSHASDFLISTSWDGSTRLWDPISGRQLLYDRGNHFVAIRNDDRQMALLNRNGDLSLWEVAGSWECRTLHYGQVGNCTPRPTGSGSSIDFSPDGCLLVSNGTDGVRLWDMETFAEVGHLPAGPTSHVLFHPDGNSLFTYGPDGLKRWPIGREIERTPTSPAENEVLHIGPPQLLDVPGNWVYAGFSLDRRGHKLAAVDFPHDRVVILDLDHPGQKLVIEGQRIVGCHLSPNGEWAVTTDAASLFKVWNTSDGKSVSWSPPAEERFVGFTADSCWVVSSPTGQMHFHYWQIATGQMDLTSTNDKKLICHSASPDGTLLLWVESGSMPPKLIDVRTEKLLAVLEPPRDVGSAGWRFSPDGTRIVVATGNHTIHVWDLVELRRNLAELGLDWDPQPCTPRRSHDTKPIRVEVHPATSDK
jgi:WD40 repeat protein